MVDVEALDFAKISPGGFASLIKDLPKRELATVAAGPSRGRIVDEILSRMAASFDPGAAGRLKALIRWRIVDAGQPDIPFEMDIADGTCQVSLGTTDRAARLGLTMSTADFARLVSGNATGTALFMTRRLKVTGDLGLAASLVRYFDIPKA
jgi:predicted lipid carrier protein YhbT